MWRVARKEQKNHKSPKAVKNGRACAKNAGMRQCLRLFGFLFSLTAEETFRFSDTRKAYLQLRAQSQDGTVFGTKPQAITVYPMNDDFSEDSTLPTPDENGWIIFDGGTIVP